MQPFTLSNLVNAFCQKIHVQTDNVIGKRVLHNLDSAMNVRNDFCSKKQSNQRIFLDTRNAHADKRMC